MLKIWGNLDFNWVWSWRIN